MAEKVRRRRRKIVMTGTKLKIYACVTMLFYTIGMSVVQNGLLHVNDYTSEELADLLSSNADMMILSTWASVLQLIGGLAVPVFAFLLVEGFQHTSSYRRYLLTMLGFAILSEVPYDLAMSATLLDTTSQNALFTMTICLVMLYGLRLFQSKKGVLYRLSQGTIILAAILWCNLLGCSFGLCTVLLTAVYYLLYDRAGLKVIMGCAISTMYVTGPFSTYAIWSYDGERGWNKNKYLFYVFYPLHLLILGLLTYVIA